MNISGMAAVVTGGASGLGEATARSLAEGGAKVAIFDLNEERGAVEFLFGEVQLGLALDDYGLCLRHGLPGAGDIGVGFVEACLDLVRVHAGQDLSGLDHVALFHRHLGDATRVLGGDVHLFGLDAAVAGRDVIRQPRLLLLPPDPAAGAGSRRDSERNQGFAEQVHGRRRHSRTGAYHGGLYDHGRREESRNHPPPRRRPIRAGSLWELCGIVP